MKTSTRIKKMEEGQADGIILAAAGIKRLGLDDRITHYFSFDEMVPEGIEQILDRMEGERKIARNIIPDEKKRKEYLTEKFYRLLDGEDSINETQMKGGDPFVFVRKQRKSGQTRRG